MRTDHRPKWEDEDPPGPFVAAVICAVFGLLLVGLVVWLVLDGMAT